MRSPFSPHLILITILGFFIAILQLLSTKNYSFQQDGCDMASCIEYYMNSGKFKEADIIEVLQSHYLISPPSPTAEDKFNLSTYYPPWKELMQWDSIQELLLNFFRDQPLGTFVEVGAVDGLFLSQTFYLEKKLNWTGLLIEPDPRSFSRLLNSKRNAIKVPLCINNIFPCVQKFWLRKIEKNLPEHFEQLLLARSIIAEEMFDGDEERGGCTLVTCVPLSLVAKAANIKTIDFLTIATGGENDHLKIDDVLKRRKVNVKTLLIHIPATVQAIRPMTQIPGYIMDAVRSQVLYKFYIKKSYCKLQSTTDCVKLEHFKFKEACLKYICFGNIPVNAVNLENKKNNTII